MTGVTKLQSLHLRKGSAIGQNVAKMLELNPPMKDSYQFPGPEHDQLFQAEYDHESGARYCDSCNKNNLVIREPREASPVVHYGLIGSANRVIRNGPTRETLRQERGIICFEMEAAGLMDTFPCLVVRGICDYADTHKNERWQPYAAATAAAYAKELLEIIPVDHVTSAEKAADVMQALC